MLFSRTLRWAVAVSIGIHLVLLLAGRGYWSSWLADDEPDLLAVRLLPPVPSPPPPAPKPPRRQSPPTVPVVTAPAAASAPAAPSGVAGGPSLATAPTAGAAKPEAIAPSPAMSARTLPGSGHMRFTVTKGGQEFIVGRAVHDWKVDGNRYELKSVIETAGIIALFVDVRLGQTSAGRIDAEGLHPEFFQDNRKDGQYRSEFDWAGGTLKLSNNTVVPLAPGAQDLLSMFYQLALYPLDTPQVSLMVTTGRKFERYVFNVQADVPLMLNPRTDGRLVATYHLSYRGRDEEGVEVWLARDMARLPVKIRYTDRKGGVTEMYAEEINYSGKN